MRNFYSVLFYLYRHTNWKCLYTTYTEVAGIYIVCMIYINKHKNNIDKILLNIHKCISIYIHSPYTKRKHSKLITDHMDMHVKKESKMQTSCAFKSSYEHLLWQIIYYVLVLVSMVVLHTPVKDLTAPRSVS